MNESSLVSEPAVQTALAELLLTMADDEFVLGYWDSEWTGIAPMLEEDVAMSSLAQDEIGHARALYELLADLTGDTADSIAYGREPDAYRHARLLDHPRTDWALTICRRWLYETADSVRSEALTASTYAPLAELIAKLRREERYHLMHVDTWMRRMAAAEGEPRERLVAAWELLAPDAGTVLAPVSGEAALVEAGILAMPMTDIEQRWRAAIGPVLTDLRMPVPPPARDPEGARTEHSEAFRWLWGEFTMVARLEPDATW